MSHPLAGIRGNPVVLGVAALGVSCCCLGGLFFKLVVPPPAGPKLFIIVANGLHGPIRLVRDGNAPPLPSSGGMRVARIPASGVLKVASLYNMEYASVEGCYYADGRQLPVLGPEQPNIFGLVNDGVRYDGDGKDLLILFVGTWNEAYNEHGLEKLPGQWTPGKHYGK